MKVINNYKLRVVTVTLIFFCLITGLNADTSSIDPDATWHGLIQVHQYGPKIGGEGTLLTRWEIEASWKEKKHLDVKNKDGEKTGQFIFLED